MEPREENVTVEIEETVEAVEPKPKKTRKPQNRKNRDLDTLLEAPIRGMLPTEKDLVIKALRDANNLLVQQNKAYENLANEGRIELNRTREYYDKIMADFNTKFRAITVFAEAINKTVKGE